MNKLWVFGDSFTFGDGCRSDKGILDGDLEYYNQFVSKNYDLWPNLLAKKVGYELENLSKSGASNDFIFDSIINSIENIKSEDTIIISKTFSQRFDIPISDRTLFKTIFAENLFAIEQSINYGNLKDKIEKETILNYGVLYASHKSVKARQNKRFDFIYKLLKSKTKNVFIWDVDSDFRKSFNTISQHSNNKFNDYHFSFLGHSEFAEAMFKVLFSEKNIL